jgi:hypothetical protein
MKLRAVAPVGDLVVDGKRFATVEEWEAARAKRAARQARLLARIDAEQVRHPSS